MNYQSILSKKSNAAHKKKSSLKRINLDQGESKESSSQTSLPLRRKLLREKEKCVSSHGERMRIKMLEIFVNCRARAEREED